MSDFNEHEKKKRHKRISLFLANTKNIEQIIHAYDSKPDNFTMGELRQELSSVTRDQPLGNQWWGILMLYSLIPIKDFNYNKNKPQPLLNKETTDKLKVIRDSLAHDDISITENKLIFGSKDKKDSVEISYAEFPKFISDIYVPFVENYQEEWE